jgi:hypothetical protein
MDLIDRHSIKWDSKWNVSKKKYGQWIENLFGTKQFDNKDKQLQPNWNHRSTDFPEPCLDELREITIGVYQMKQTPCYTTEYLTEDWTSIV